MECLVFSTLKKKPNSISFDVIRTVAHYVLRREQRPGLLSVHLIADTKMKRLQREHRGKTGTTDVLSFAAQEGDWQGDTHDLGDIFLSVPQIERQAKTWSVSFREECIRLLIHGILHILGYDHIAPGEAKIMFSKQENYLKKWV